MSVKINQYFNIHYGNRIYHNKTWLDETYFGSTPLISSKSKNRGVYGYFNISPEYANIITVPSTGTVCHALFQKKDCAVDDNTLVLEPLINLSDREMVFYSLVIRQYKLLFMYGRQVTPTRLGEIFIPSKEEIPNWVNNIKINTYEDIKENKNKNKVKLPPINKWKKFNYNEIFNMHRGNGGTITAAKNIEGNNEFISSSSENNGISFYTGKEPTEKGNTITIANNGSVGEAFYHSKPYLATSDVTVLELKNYNLTPSIAMFLITLIKKEQFKFNYGRKWGIARMENSNIMLPITKDGTPDWQLIEDYINSLPYSKYL